MKDAVHSSLPKLIDMIQLMRLDRPIGIYLLLWPTLWALWLASDGIPKLDVLAIFIIGTAVMRSAGCVINDYADRHIDGHVKRTHQRPMATGKVSEKQALSLFAGLVIVAFLLVLMTNPLTISLSFAGLTLAFCYPFMKRYTHLPQIVLGAAFSWGIPMAWAAQTGAIAPTAWLLFFANLLWTTAYDTQYAMVDRDDDLKIGVKSTAILFGHWDNAIIIALQCMAIALLVPVGILEQISGWYYLGLLAAGLLFINQYRLTKERERNNCFKAFLSNHWAGAAIFAGIVADLTSASLFF